MYMANLAPINKRNGLDSIRSAFYPRGGSLLESRTPGPGIMESEWNQAESIDSDRNQGNHAGIRPESMESCWNQAGIIGIWNQGFPFNKNAKCFEIVKRWRKSALYIPYHRLTTKRGEMRWNDIIFSLFSICRSKTNGGALQPRIPRLNFDVHHRKCRLNFLRPNIGWPYGGALPQIPGASIGPLKCSETINRLFLWRRTTVAKFPDRNLKYSAQIPQRPSGPLKFSKCKDRLALWRGTTTVTTKPYNFIVPQIRGVGAGSI